MKQPSHRQCTCALILTPLRGCPVHHPNGFWGKYGSDGGRNFPRDARNREMRPGDIVEQVRSEKDPATGPQRGQVLRVRDGVAFVELDPPWEEEHRRVLHGYREEATTGIGWIVVDRPYGDGEGG